MEKLHLQTTNIVDENIRRIGELFPNCLTERLNEKGQPETAIDFDQLRQELSKDIVEGPEERYQFTWPDKRNAIRLANAPTTDTLRPCREESVDFDNTQNLYIEGDNLQVLKLLRENYLGKVKMIYIDPPYNTGNDFVYNDDFSQSAGEYMHNSGQEDEEGNRLVANSESNGRFHTDWLNMIYPRLNVAKDLLSEDGVIFISIDDNEEENLRKICNEIYGEHNFLADIVWKHTQQSKNDELHFSRQYNHTLCFCKKIDNLHRFYFSRTEEDNKNYSNPDNDPKGMWRSGDVRSPNYRKTLCFDIIAPNGNIIKAPDNGWRWSEESIKEKIGSGEIIFKKDYSGIIRKIYLCDQEGRTPENLWEGVRFGTTRTAAAVIKSLFDNKQVFDTPKPHELIMRMMEIATVEDSTVLDFFSGSATTAHAVIQLNSEDGGKRKFIMVQLPEATDEKSEAYKAGYKNICEIGKERIRRAGKKIKEDSPLTTQDLDTGTGKTYVYIKTMFEMNKRYGWSKFIVVVPSIAIREGVQKSFSMLEEHFMEQYGKKARYFIYDSSNLTQIDGFSSDASINVMIINTQAFARDFKEGAKNKVSLIMYTKRDDFQSRRPIDVIAANRPIIIMDEPQKMEGAATQKALKHFKPLFVLNYSATHKTSHNCIYALDAYDAYRQKLVKKIQVKGITVQNLLGAQAYIYFDSIVLWMLSD